MATMTNLPPELIFYLFTKLPVKSLFRFKCISKSTLALISDPSFVKIYSTTSQRQRLLLSTPSFNSVDLETASSDGKLVLEQQDLQETDSLSIYGSSCNGLVCLKKMKYVQVPIEGLLLSYPRIGSFVIYNPSTRESRTIAHDENDDINHVLLTPLYGFGYLESSDDYKFVKFYDYTSTVEIFSLRDSSWKIIKNVFEFRRVSCGPGIYLNGAIHWLMTTESLIAAFDLEEEKFRTFRVPEVFKSKFDYFHGVLGDCLVLYGSSPYQFWVMKKYGVEESWTEISISMPFDSMQPLCYIKDSGEMLLVLDKKKLVIYNEDLGTCKDLALKGDSMLLSTIIQSSMVHVESLISPNFNNSV